MRPIIRWWGTVILRLSLRLLKAAVAGGLTFLIAMSLVIPYEERLAQSIHSGMSRSDVEHTLSGWRSHSERNRGPKGTAYVLCYSGFWYDAHVAYDKGNRVVGCIYDD
jgi:hypothetical protein